MYAGAGEYVDPTEALTVVVVAAAPVEAIDGRDMTTGAKGDWLGAVAGAAGEGE